MSQPVPKTPQAARPRLVKPASRKKNEMGLVIVVLLLLSSGGFCVRYINHPGRLVWARSGGRARPWRRERSAGAAAAGTGEVA